MKRVFLSGQENIGWSVDADFQHTRRALQAAGYILTNTLRRAPVGYFVWWNQCRKRRYRMAKLLGKRFVAVVTNDIAQYPNQAALTQALRVIDYWCYANNSQRDHLIARGVAPNRVFYNPFYVDEFGFRDFELPRAELARRLGIAPDRVKGRFLIGSFQRDSKGGHLSQPKQEKNPLLLAKVLMGLPKDKILLVLAGPRRHYLVSRCRELGIPYLFAGDESHIDALTDDMAVNNLDSDKVNLLYNLVDLYLISSRSEGGPKAVIEASLTRTPILSTSAGMAPELLDPYCLCGSVEEFQGKILEFMEDRGSAVSDANYRKVLAINNFDAFKERVAKVVAAALRV